MKKLFFIFSIITVLAACTHKIDKRLSAIAETVSSEPLPALDSLEKINVKELSRSDKHYYDFLTVKAKDKAYITHISDSLILDVINYYKSGKDKTLYSEALYYGGRVYSDLGDYPTALNYFHQALDKLPESSKGTNLESRIVSQTGRLLNTLRLYEEAVPYVERSIEINRLNRDTLNWVYNLQLLGGIYMREEQNKKAEKYLYESLELSKGYPESISHNAILYLARIKMKEDSISPSLSMIRQVLNKKEILDRNTALAFAAKIYRNADKYDSAFLYANELLKSINPDQKKSAYEVLLSEEVNPYLSSESMRDYVLDYRKILEKEYNENESQLLLDRQNIYNYRIHEIKRIESEKNIRKLEIGVAFILFILLLAIIIILYQKTRNKNNIIRYQKAIEEIRNLELSLNEKDIIIKKSEEELKKITPLSISDVDTSGGLRIILQNELMSLYKKNPVPPVSSKILNSETYLLLKTYIASGKTLGEGDPFWNDLETLILEDSPRFIKSLTILLGGRLSLIEKHTVFLIRLGICPSEISILAGRAKNTISTRRETLGKKMFGKKIEPKMVDSIIRLL